MSTLRVLLLRHLTLVLLTPLFAACATVPRGDPVAMAPRPETAAAVQRDVSGALETAAQPAQISAPPLPVAAVQPVAAPVLLDLTVSPDNLWQRIRNGFGMPDLHHPLVAERQSWYLNRPEALRRIFGRGERYLHHIVEELERRGMPTELALLPMVESSFNPHAVSRAQAVGLWQFIPSTGKAYQLDQNWWLDERRDIVASTDAALTYLQRIYELHGDWHLTLASYNWGKGAVGRAIARNHDQGLPTDYSSLTMPAETRNYVPKLQALKNIVAHPEYFGFQLPEIANQPYFDSVMKPERIDIAVAARLAEIPVEEFILLNPAYHRPVIKGGQASGALLLPVDSVGVFQANLERYLEQDKPLSNWLTYRMKKGDTLAKVAARFKMSVARLRQINGITPRVRVGPGFTLLVPRPGSQAAATTGHARPQSAPSKPAKASGGKQTKAKAGKPPGAKPAAKKPGKPPRKPQSGK